MSNDYFNPPNSIWPNGLKRDGKGFVTFYPLGTNKVDISTITWPEGDKLVSPFVYQNDELVGFVDTKALTVSGSATTTMNYNHIEADFASISKGTLTVNAPNAAIKKFSWAVFQNDSYIIIDFSTTDQETIDVVRSAYRVVDKIMYAEDGSAFGIWDTSKLEISGITSTPVDGLFCKSDILSEFNSDLSSLSSGAAMFPYCTNLTSFSSNLSSLTMGYLMFTGCSNLTSFSSNLSSLTNGYGMFSGCPFTSFSSDLSNLTIGYGMFLSCSNLTSFSSNLSSLTDGTMMFAYCKLDVPSVKNIIDTINTVSSGSLVLGMGCNNTTEDMNLFAQEVGYTDINSLATALKTKGWKVQVQGTGRPTTTYGLRRPSENTLPVFVKLEETKDYANYTSENGSKKYILNWFHKTTDSTEGYIQFNSLEEAVAHFNIKPIERN